MQDKQSVGSETDSGLLGKSLREAGPLEQFFHARSRCHYQAYVVVTARYEHPSGHELSKGLVFAALEKTIKKQPPLASRLPAPGSPPVWLYLPSLDLNDVVTFSRAKSSELSTLIEQIFEKPVEYADDLPHWKLLVLRDGTVAFAFDHALGDGQSGISFHRTLLAELRNFHEPLPEHSGIVTLQGEDASLLLPLERAMDVSPPFTMILSAILKLTFPFLKRKEQTAWTGHPVVTSATMETNVRIVHSTPEQAASLIELFREHRATVTSVLHILALVVLSRLVSTQPDKAKWQTISSTIPISLRRFAGAPQGAICNYISSYECFHPIPPLLSVANAGISAKTFPWGAASSLTQTLRREAPRSGASIGLIKYLNGKYQKFFEGQLGKKRSAGLETSNLGLFPADPVSTDSADANTWRIGEMLFAQAGATLGAALKLNVVGTPVGGVGVTITWGRGAVDNDFAEDFVRGFESGFKGLLDSETSAL